MTIAMRPIDKLLPLATNVVPNGDHKWKCNCTIHESDGKQHDPSLHITEKPDGTLLIKCMACDATQPQIVHGFGLTMSDLFPDHGPAGVKQRKRGKAGKKVAEFIYRDPQGGIAYRVERFEPKNFLQSRPNGEGGWIYSVKGTQLLPYRLPELIAAPLTEYVFIVEGERKVEALRDWGLIATCNAGGAKKWQKSFSERFLKGRKVIILPDNDPINPENGESKGWEHAKDVLTKTKPFAESVRILELPGLPPKGDIIDWISQGGTLPQLMELVVQPWTEDDTTNQIESVQADQLTEVNKIAEMDPLDLRIPESRTDVGNGKRIVRAVAGRARFCSPWGKWLVYDAGRWKEDDSLSIVRTMKDVARSMWGDLATFGKDVSPEMFGKIGQFARISSGMAGINRAMEAAQSELTILPREMDSDPWLLNVKNGTVDLRTGELQPHNPDDLITKVAPVDFDTSAECPEWEKFIASIFGTPELCGYVQRLCGYWVTGIVREQMLPILWGSGSNGKSTFLEVFMKTIGEDYTMMAPPGFVMARMHDTHPTELADLFGKRFVLTSETEEGKRLNEAMVKSLTGSDKIRARRMRENFWEFDPSHKIALVTNHQPIIRGTDTGIWRRIRMIPFSKKFWNPDIGETGPEELRQVKGLGDRLLAESSGILSWVVRGCIDWLHDGERAPEEVLSMTNAYQSTQDVFKTFLEECCTIDSNGVAAAADLYKAFKKWAETNNEWAGSSRRFGQLMTERGFERYKNNTIYYHGLLLNDGSDF